MIDLSNVQHHPAVEEIVDVLCNRTQNTDRGFFRGEVVFFLGKMAATQRSVIMTKDRGEIPVNIYALLLATSGYGKGHSINIMEEELIAGFKKRFMEDVYPTIAETSLWDIANDKAALKNTEPEEEYNRVKKELEKLGVYPFTFDSGTAPAVKQLRQMLLMANSGSINLQIDEIGSNLIGNVEVLTLFLELYDQGKVKQKLIKNTSDNVRGEEYDGKTPTNMLLFGTPSKLFDGGMTEDQFYSFLETGYARRCVFGSGVQHRADSGRTAAEIYNLLIQPQNNAAIHKWAMHFQTLADPTMFGWQMKVEDDVGILLMEYKLACERAADQLPEHEEIKKAEMSHRYFRALKVAGAYAFVDRSMKVEIDHLMSAILLMEESGEAFQKILSREKSYIKLAKYIASTGKELTHTDLLEALPFYGRTSTQRNELMNLAIAWGYREHIIIKKTFVDTVEFFRGETLEETNLDEIMVSYSDHFAYHYQDEVVPFDKLDLLMQAKGYHWVNHHLKDGHRSENTVKAGFNMIVLDVDEGISLEQAHELMKDYVFATFTTKRHTPDQNRFRMIIPMNYKLFLDQEEYKEFMNTLLSWLPFKVDESVNQRAKKWETHDLGYKHFNLEGELLDVREFIPRTARNETFQKNQQQLGSLDNLERWFATRMSTGNRNNQMIRYAMALVDSGMLFADVKRHVLSFNKKLSNPLPEDELDSTVLVTVAKSYKE